ncbi:proteasome activator complex subunit 4A-like isoform X2 [Malaya genurostris]|uniref:proteasome activator complex subunit 4A-like isoform X2 n=1 Tax=Malaya genurostris TaxID=325434 RepID=UPI0026F384F9|nr:proteasome activator complex subunit 4A-like isoform X2 [Malaya genurostris]
MDDESSESLDLSRIKRNERIEKLGFRPQKELFCNKFLPYADRLDDESQVLLENIKNNLGKAAAMREITPGVSIYVSRLSKYIKLYGMKFSKEDHIKFVKLLLELITIPNLEPDKVNKFCYTLTTLLRKPEWLSPDDIQIAWRPLYKLSNLILNKNCSKGDLYRCFSSLETNLQFVIQYCAPYFPRSSTQEILDELLPKLQPLDTGKVIDTFGMLHIFLSCEHDYDLWFDKFMDIWNAYHNPPWGIDMMTIFATVGFKNIGYIDWESHIPTMFARILRSIDFPVSYKSTKSSKLQNLAPQSIAIWIVSVLGPQSSAQQYLNKFMATIESYLHPANMGKWVSMLGEILVQLPKYFFDRLILERYRKHPYRRPIPESHKLTEDCITAFVECMKPVAFQAMYSRMNPQDVGKIFQHLADLRPALIIPTIIDRVYASLDSLTEPHKMTAALQSLIGVSRALVSAHNGYTEGRNHVIPIFFATLPGIDPNDFKKTSITFHFLTSISFLIPIVDCSKAGQYHELTEDERLLCEQTADFENFVLQYMDRIFLLIESSSVDNVRMEQSDTDSMRSKLESISEALVQACTHGILGQCSRDILNAASKKLIDFIKTRLLEPKVAGQLVGCLVRVFTRIHGKEVLRSLIPYVVQTIERYMEDHEDIAEVEKQNDEMLYYLLLLTNMMRGDPAEVVKYIDDVLPILDKILKFKCKQANKYGSTLLANLMSNLSTMQTLDVKNSPLSFEKPLSEFLPIKSWGEKMTPDGKIDWCFPDQVSAKVCERLMHRYLVPILDSIQKYCSDELELSRDDINRDVTVIQSLIRCQNFLPNWDDEESLSLFESCLDRTEMRWTVTRGFDDLIIKMPDGQNVRKTLIQSVSALQRKIMEKSEDDIKSLKSILMLYDKLYMRKHSNSAFDNQVKTFNNTKKFQTYRLTKFKRDVRAVVATRVIMQQDCRDEMDQPLFSATHLEVMMNLLEMSTSHYSSVRATAQSKLFTMLSTFSFSYKLLVDKIEEHLRLDSNEHHERFKGILFVLVSNRRSRLVIKNDWQFVSRIWVTLLQSKLSEKPSVVKLLDAITDVINNEFPTTTTELEVSNACVQHGLALRVRNDPLELEAGRQARLAKNGKNVQIYYDLIAQILTTVQNDKLHWRYHYMASSMLYNLVHPLTNFPPAVAQFAVNNLIHDSLDERKMAICLLNHILRQQKREHAKVDINPYTIAGLPEKAPSNGSNVEPGYRDDNQWLQYDLEKVPKNQDEWDQPRYMYKTEGYFGWSSNFTVYAPSKDQPKLDRSLEEMNECEQIVYKFFIVQENVDKLIKFWSLEEKKGRDKFNRNRFCLIKGLMNTFGDLFLSMFVKHLRPLIDDKASESSHRCAAEIMAGIMRGAKHWPFEKTAKMYEDLVPLTRLALNNVTVDTDVFWGTCFATAAENMDPSKQYWLHEVLLEDPLQESTSFIDCNRLYCLQGAFNQHVWRMTSVAKRLLEYLRPYLNHSFQNVRERLGSTLINIFEADLKFNGVRSLELSPKTTDMISYVMPKLSVLLSEEHPPIVEKMEVEGESSQASNAKKEGSEYEVAVRLFKTVAQWLTCAINRCSNGNETEYFELLPIACRLERCEQDQELAEICTMLLAMISQALTLVPCMEIALTKIDEISKMSSWSARRSVIDVLQVLVFYNMTIILSKDQWIAKIQEIVLRLLEDNVVEVREKAAEVLCGLLHCSFLTATDELLDLFKTKCRTKMIKARRLKVATSCSNEVNKSDGLEANAVRARHSGVLGLCAFISAYPYEVPEFVPNVFEHLGAHLNDPQPIPATIRKTMGDFKRTHHDNWEAHQLKFTEDQLAVLSDLTIPPSYYA